jgi:FAD-dependent urate hydroxylase
MVAIEKALVIGAGIAGPAVALALHRIGVEAVVYEAYPEPADHVGSFLNTASNGIAALQQLALADEVVRAGIPTPHMTFWSGSGKYLGQVANGSRLPDGKTSTTIRRGDLNRILREAALAEGIRIESGRRLVHADSAGSVVHAHFDDGTSASGDLLVGADGIHSAVRRMISADTEKPRYSGLLSVGGQTRGVDVDASPGTFNMMFGRDAFFSHLVREPGEVWWFANLPEPQEPARGRLATVSVKAWRERLLRTFAPDRGPATALLSAADDHMGAYAIHDLPTVTAWHRDRMVLLGDAAHATSPSAGQGASMALESALQLTVCLRDAATLADALTDYETIRRPRVERVVRYSARLSGSKTAGPIGRRLRDLAMPFALKHFANPAAHAWMYDHRIDLGTPVR